MIPDATPSPRSGQGDCGYTRAYALVVTAAILAAVLLRFGALDRYPAPLHQDELSNIYDGYSLATTGADRAGVRWPILLRAMGPGDYRPALYAYLAAVTTGIGGFSTWAGRVPAAVVGVLTVVLVFLFARRLLGNTGGLLALLFATFSPILIQYGRQAHEGACLPPFFAILTVYLLYRAMEPPLHAPGSEVRENRRGAHLLWLAGAGFAAGLSASTYGAQRLTAPLFAVLGSALILWQTGRRQRSPRRAGMSLLAFSLGAGVGALPQIFAMIHQPENFFARAGTVMYDWRNGPRWWARILIAGYTTHFSARQLFFSMGDYTLLSVARLSVAAFPFLYVGLAVAAWRAIARRDPACVVLLAGVMICILPGVASRGSPSVLRVSGVWALYPVVAALGAIGIGSAVREGWRRLMRNHPWPGGSARLATAALAIAIVAVGVRNINEYLAHPQWHNAAGQGHLMRIGEWLGEHGEGYDRIYVDTPGYFPYLYVAVFTGMHPAEFQQTVREGEITPTGWETIQRFGRFHFADLSQAESDWAASDRDESWLYLNADGDTVTFRPAGVERRHHQLALAPGSPRVRHP